MSHHNTHSIFASPWSHLLDNFLSDWAILFFYIVGFSFIVFNFLKYTFRFFRNIAIFESNLPARYGKNSWVVITGASDGIGKEFSIQLAKRGFNIALIAKNDEKLTNVEREIQQRYPQVQTMKIVKDFKNSMEPKFYEEIASQLSNVNVSILINNVGVLLKGQKFHERDPIELRDSMIINCLPSVMMTRHLLPRMLERNHKSAVITMSSTVITEPRKDKALYSATKIFVDFLSQALQMQYPGIDWLSLRPGPVTTKMIDKKTSDFQTASTREFVTGGLKCLGKMTESAGTLKHAIRSKFYR